MPQPLLTGSFYTSAQRDVLNHMPYLALLGVAALLSVFLALGVRWVTRRYGSAWLSSADSGVVAGVAAMVLTLFALLLAFAIVNLYTQHQETHAAVAQEADDLALVQRDARIIGAAGVGRSIRTYVCEVENQEFPRMHNGNAPPKSSYALVDHIFTTLNAYDPRTASDAPFFQSAVDRLNDAVAQRRDRVESVNDVLPEAFAGLLILTATISIFLVCLLRVAGQSESDGDGDVAETRADWMEALLVCSVTFVVVAGLATALLFEFPFSGPLQLSSRPFQLISGC